MGHFGQYLDEVRALVTGQGKVLIDKVCFELFFGGIKRRFFFGVHIAEAVSLFVLHDDAHNASGVF